MGGTMIRWTALCVIAATLASAHGALLETCTEDISAARAREFARSKGGSESNRVCNTDECVRYGRFAFKHWVNTEGERAELAMSRTEIGGTYWYGWSMLLPEGFDPAGSSAIVMQLATWPTKRNRRFPCGANGPYVHVRHDGKMVFHLQHAGDSADAVCDEFVLADDISRLKGKWLDFVMQACWTGDTTGFVKCWMKVADNNYLQKVNYQGPTWWNDEDAGPYLKIGA